MKLNSDLNQNKKTAKRRAGITLPEVLIAFVVIGITSKLLIPTIYWTVAKIKLCSRYTKSYSEMAQCIKTAERDEGNFTTWVWEDDEQVFRKYFKPYLRMRRLCGKGADVDCGSNASYKYLNGSEAGNPFSDTNYRFITDDGARWAFKVNSDCAGKAQYCAMFRVDLNGDEKPNVFGRDVFTFYMLPFTNEIVPEGLFKVTESGYNSTTGWPKATYQEVNTNCDKNGTGTYCGARIIQDGYTMDY